MIDIQLLRDDPERVRKAIALKKFDCDLDLILELDAQRRMHIGQFETLRSEQKAANQEMASLPKDSPAFLEKVAQMKTLATQVKELELATKEIEELWLERCLTIPNLPDASVPLGKGEDDNQVFLTWGDTTACSPHAKPHYDIHNFDKAIDFPRGVKVTGAGFPFYVGSMARLVRALIQFFLDEARTAGYTELLAPLVVNQASATATGQLPDKEGQMYVIPSQDLYMIPTAEVPVTNFFRDEIIEAKDLPLRYCAYTPCFRREAGSWGKDVRGLNRLHQFDKVELVQWSHPETSFEELDTLRQHSEGLLQKLGLPYRVLLMCTKDIGFPHAKQYDLEVWAAGQGRWLEVSSCSNFTDFQARRAGIRFRSEPGAKPQTVHTLNGSALAIPRTLAALLENNLQEDGSIRIPEVLHPWFGGDRLVLGE
jgi:seryl-tRNA synthetase